jgi:ABC-type branched-subunit amino acid transport system permease subunit
VPPLKILNPRCSSNACHVLTSNYGGGLVGNDHIQLDIDCGPESTFFFGTQANTRGAAIAGLGGMLYVPQMKIITPWDMEASMSILVVVWVAVGGRGTLSGAVLGTLSVLLLKNFLTSEHDPLFFLQSVVSESFYNKMIWKAEYWQFVLGGLFIGVVLFFPDGLIRLWHRLVGQPKTGTYGT